LVVRFFSGLRTGFGYGYGFRFAFGFEAQILWRLMAQALGQQLSPC
jgi:hypothetical protein